MALIVGLACTIPSPTTFPNDIAVTFETKSVLVLAATLPLTSQNIYSNFLVSEQVLLKLA